VERAAIEDTLQCLFAAAPAEAAAVYLYGSVARGTHGAKSDVDVAVLLGRDPAPGWAGLPLALEGRLERALGRPVQLVVLERAPLDLVHRVLRDARLVWEADRAARVRFEVRARREYDDLWPHLRRYRRLDAMP
jgi:predicted nucleotidyltransferase